MVSFGFDRIVIVESLPEREFHSGTELGKYLSTLIEDPKAPPQIELVLVANASQFRAVIDELAYEARNNEVLPLLHIETHGWEDASGLVFADDSELEWDEVRNVLGPLNVATKFNLVVSMAACFGGHFIQELRPGQSAPALVVIGPTHTTDGAELLGRFRDFYRTLIETLDVPLAIEALNSSPLSTGGFITTLAEDWFQKVLMGYIEKSCTKSELDRRARLTLQAVRANGKQITLEQVQAIGYDRVRTLLDDYASKFFAFHLLPENADRFKGTLDSARERIAKFIAEQGY